MHGHALSGTRKLNRHWQSGVGNKIIEENLVLFERYIDETEWVQGQSPYFERTASSPSYFIESWLNYGSAKNNKRTIKGIKPFVIKQSGDYKLHWDLEFRNIESFTRDGVTYDRITSVDRSNIGMYGAIMYGAGEYHNISLQAPNYNITTNDGVQYHVGEARDYIAQTPGGFGAAATYINTSIVQLVTPRRSDTVSFILGTPWSGAYSFAFASANENPELIFHIGQAAPFYNYEYNKTGNNEVYFIKGLAYSSPCFRMLFVNNGNSYSSDYIVLGKIWLERIGNYTQGFDRFLPKIISVPAGYTILGDGGIL